MFNESLPRVFTSQNLACNQEINLDPAAAKHLVQVLRLKPSAKFTIFNGQGGEYIARILAATKSQTRIIIETFADISRESSLKIELWQGISRGEKMDFTIQKAVELGVIAITPLFTEYCNVKVDQSRLENKINHWRGVAIAAAEQSGRCLVPEIAAPLHFRDAITKVRSAMDNTAVKIILTPRTPLSLIAILSQNFDPNKKIILVVGPEGGLSYQEENLAIQNGWAAAQLGPRILRTETAALAAISMVASLDPRQ